MTTQVSVPMVTDGVKTFSSTVRIADPTVDSHPIKLRFPLNARILRVNGQTRSGTSTDTVTFTIKVGGVALADYTGLLSTAANGVETRVGSDIPANDIPAGSAVEVSITALGGTGHNYFDVEVEGVLR